MLKSHLPAQKFSFKNTRTPLRDLVSESGGDGGESIYTRNTEERNIRVVVFQVSLIM